MVSVRSGTPYEHYCSMRFLVGTWHILIHPNEQDGLVYKITLLECERMQENKWYTGSLVIQ